MQKQTRNWLLFTASTFVLMNILVPAKSRRRLYPFGLCFGFTQAIFLNWYSVRNNQLWKLPGDLLIKGIPVLTCLSWISPSIIFAYYFPYNKLPLVKSIYILLFASGTTLAQYFHGIVGMWESKNWKPIYTLPLSIATHVFMTGGMFIFGTNKLRND